MAKEKENDALEFVNNYPTRIVHNETELERLGINLAIPKLSHQFRKDGKVKILGISIDSKKLVTFEFGKIYLWDVKADWVPVTLSEWNVDSYAPYIKRGRGGPSEIIGVGPLPRKAIFSPKGDKIAISFVDSTWKWAPYEDLSGIFYDDTMKDFIMVHDLNMNTPPVTLHPKTHVISFDFHPTKNIIAATCKYGKVEIWNLEKSTLLKTLPAPLESNRIAFHPRRDIVFIAGKGGGHNWTYIMYIIDQENSRPPIKLKSPEEITALAFHPSKDLLIVERGDAILVFDIEKDGLPATWKKASIIPTENFHFSKHLIDGAEPYGSYKLFDLGPDESRTMCGCNGCNGRTGIYFNCNILINEDSNWWISYWSLKDSKLLCKLYQSVGIFIWHVPSEPEQQNAKSGWFYTNCPDLIQVMKINKDGKEVELPVGDESRERYINTYNNWEVISARINTPGDLSTFEKFLAKIRKEVKQELELMRHEIKFLTSGID